MQGALSSLHGDASPLGQQDRRRGFESSECKTKNDQADLGSESEHVRAPVNVGRVTPIVIC